MDQVTIKNSNLSLTILNYGAVIQRLMVLDKNNSPINVVVGLELPEAYFEDKKSLGATIGRYAGRISGGGFNLDHSNYQLQQEEGVHLHGGKNGFSKKFWNIDEVEEGENPSVSLSYTSLHLEEGYPGQLEVKVTYRLRANALEIVHEAETDRPTVINLTNHSYFKLDDHHSLEEHRLTLNCNGYLETDDKILPTGKILPVESTDYDFQKEKSLKSIDLDTPFVVNDNSAFVAKIHSQISGISMKVSSNQPAVVVYTPPEFPAICFETQNFPDAPNFDHFPTSVLRPGETYINKSIFEFDLVN